MSAGQPGGGMVSPGEDGGAHLVAVAVPRGADRHQEVLRLEAERGGEALAAQALASGRVEGAGGVAVLHREPDVVAVPSEADPGRAVGLSPDQLGPPWSARSAPPRAGSPGTPSRAPRARGIRAAARRGRPPAGAGACADGGPAACPTWRGRSADRGRLGLGQVVALGIVGQRHLHDVEGADVRLVPLGPRHPDPHDRARGQVDDGGVLDGGGEDEEMEGGPPGGRDPLLAPGRAAEQARGSVGVVEDAAWRDAVRPGACVARRGRRCRTSDRVGPRVGSTSRRVCVPSASACRCRLRCRHRVRDVALIRPAPPAGRPG